MISEFALFVFTLLGGAAAGAYIFHAFLPESAGKKPWAFPLTALVLLVISGLVLIIHLGHFGQIFMAFSNVSSGITVEGYASLLFGVLVCVDLVLALTGKGSVRVVKVLAALAGLLLVCAMGYAYASFIGIPVWGTWGTYLMFIFGSLALGAPLAALFAEGGLETSRAAVATIVAEVLGIVGIMASGMAFVAAGKSVAPFICGAVLLAAAVVVAGMAKGKKYAWAAPTVLALAVIGLAIARYAFYAVV